MAQDTSVDLVLTDSLWAQLRQHLFRKDEDEHGAVIAAGIAEGGGRVRLLARNLFLAEDGADYVPGQRGYRMLTASFVRDCALFCRDEKLAYLAVHNHFGSDAVSFSPADLSSHDRGYPAIKDVLKGGVVGAAVFANRAAAGDIWLARSRVPLRSTIILGPSIDRLYSNPRPGPAAAGPAYDRQARLFGDRGQAILSQQRVGIVGLGGVGSLVCEYLARLGVGSLVLVDPDRLELSNICRVAGSTRWDAWSPRIPEWTPAIVRSALSRLRRSKVNVASRAARLANPDIRIEAIESSCVDPGAVDALKTCDYLVLAADSMQARLVFNALVHQYLIPGVQLGSKVQVDPASGVIARAFSVVRHVLPDSGCLWCNGLILPNKLAEEALSEDERRAQRYVDEPEVVAPSVVTMNAVTAALATNDYMFRVTGLRTPRASEDYTFVEPMTGSWRSDQPRHDSQCPECGSTPAGRLARGDARQLPVLQSPSR